jgi:hypothetical protein
MLLSTSIPVKLANAILAAVNLRENSYDKVAADSATIESNEKELVFKAEYPDRIYYGSVDYSQFYNLTLEEACESAAELTGHPSLGQVVYYLLSGTWNDIIFWAQSVLDPTATVEPTMTTCQHGMSYGYVSEIDVDDLADSPPKDLEDRPVCTLCEEFSKRNREAEKENSHGN